MKDFFGAKTSRQDIDDLLYCIRANKPHILFSKLRSIVEKYEKHDKEASLLVLSKMTNRYSRRSNLDPSRTAVKNVFKEKAVEILNS